MPQQTKIFRVFVSSTFNDMKVERKLLQDEVFPKLEQYCRENGARFQAIDLRWGVNEESQRNQKTMEICLNEIRRCQELSPRPNFLILLGDRYGWQPVPARIPSEEMAKIKKHLKPDEKRLIEEWYWLDENAVPSECVLQSWGEKVEEYTEWEPIENNIRDILRQAVDQTDLSDREKIKYFASATHQEILRGALAPPKDVKNPEEHVFAFSRTIHNLPEDKSAGDFIDLHKGKWDAASKDRLDQLKGELRFRLKKNNYFQYSAEWEKGRITLQDEKEFVEKALGHLKSIIASELEKIVDEDELNIEVRYHQEFGVKLTKHFTGRKESLEIIQHYLDNEENHRVLSLIGASGSGKTCVMARAIQEVNAQEVVLVYRFIGANANSSNLISLLGSICSQIAQAYGTTLEDLAEEHQKEKLFEINTLTDLFRKCLNAAQPDKSLILFLDALDQLSESDNAKALYWLPKVLPDQTHVVVSCLSELENRLQDTEIYQLPLMPKADGEKLLDTWLNLSPKRRLTDGQRKEVLNKFDQTGLPIYLKLAFEQARRWHSYDTPEDLPGTVPELIESLFKGLEKEHSSLLVSKAVDYILSGKDKGLTEDEILDILVFDQEYWQYFLQHSHPAHKKEVEEAGKLPVVIWSRLFMDLEPYLAERDSYGERIIVFYHRQFNEILKNKYISIEKEHHQKLAGYFHTQNFWRESLENQRKRLETLPATPRPANVRKVDELPWQRIQAQQWDELEKLITDLSFLEAKNEAGMVYTLVIDLNEALRALPVDRPRRRLVRLLGEALRRDIHFIARHSQDYPQALFQCLWNSCWWYDCPQCAAHYLPPEKSDSPYPWEQPASKLYKLLEKWRTEKEKAFPGFLWIRSSRPPALHLDAGQLAVLRGHEGCVTSVTFSPDGRRIVSGSNDNTVRLWDAESGSELAVLRVHEDWVGSTVFSPDNRRIVSGSGDCGFSKDQTVRMWDAESGIELATLHGYEGIATSVAFSRDGQRIVSGLTDKTVRVWDAESGTELTVLRGHRSWVTSVAFSLDGRRIVSGSGDYGFSKDSTVRVWDTDSGVELAVLRGHEGTVTSVAFSPDSRRIVSGSLDKTVRVWDVESGMGLAILRGHMMFIKSVAFSPNGRHIVSKSQDKTVRVWDAESGIELAVLNMVESVAFSPDGRRIVSGSYDKTVRVYDTESGSELPVLSGHEQYVLSAAFSPDGRRIVSGSLDNTVRVWDAESGCELAVLRGHKNGVISVAFSPDGRRIVSGSYDKTVRVWDAESGNELTVLRELQGETNSVAFSPDGRRIFSGSGDFGFSMSPTIRVWDAESGTQLAILYGHKGGVTSLAFCPDGHRIVSGSYDKTVRVWDAESGCELAVLRGHEGWVTSVAFSPDGHRFISGSSDLSMRVWDAESGNELAVLHGHTGDVTSVTFSPDGRYIVSGSRDRTARVWHAESGTELIVLRGHKNGVISVAFSPDGRRIVSGSMDKTVRLWDAESGNELAVLHGHTEDVTSVTFSPDGRYIVSGSQDLTVRVWHAESATKLAILREHADGISNVALSPDGHRIVSGSRDATVRVWDAESGKELTVLHGHNGGISGVAFSPDGQRIVSGSNDNTVRLWDAESGSELGVLRGHEHWVISVAFSPDGQRIVSVSLANTVRVWDAESGKELTALHGHNGSISGVAFSPDGRRIVSGSYDKTVRVWDAESGCELAVLRGHEGCVTSVVLSTDGRRIVSGSYDKTVRVWDAESGCELAVLRGHEGWVTSVAFSPDGRRLFSGSVDKTIRVWDVESGSCLEVIPGYKYGHESAIAGGLACHPIRVLGGRTGTLETTSGRTKLAWFPDSLWYFITYRNRFVWIGSTANHLQIITLEGDVTAKLHQVAPEMFS